MSKAKTINTLIDKFGRPEFLEIGSETIRFRLSYRVYIAHDSGEVLEVGDQGWLTSRTRFSKWIESILRGETRDDDGNLQAGELAEGYGEQ